VPAAYFEPVLGEHIAQHAAAGERIVHVQLVDAPHQKQIGIGDRARPVVDRGAADLQLFDLSGDW
jgi:hypothetical protein